MNCKSILTQIREDCLSMKKEELLLTATVASVFLPFVIPGVMALVCMIYSFTHLRVRVRMFHLKGFKTAMLLLALVILVPMANGSWIGIGIGLLFCILFFFVLFARVVMTRKVFENGINLACILSVLCVIVAAIEFIVSPQVPERHRSISMFVNANYYGSMIEMMIMCCIYKMTVCPKQKGFYIAVAALNGFGLVLCDSMSAWIAIFGGILTIMLIRHQRTGFNVAFACLAFCAISMFSMSEFFPRSLFLGHNLAVRESIWESAFNGFKQSPFLGHGVLGYLTLSGPFYHYPTWHAHNLYLNLLLDFGILGTALFLYYAFCMLKPIWTAMKLGYDRNLCALVIGQIAVVLIHGVTDVTYLWIQTGMFLMFLLCAPGIMKPEPKPAKEKQPSFPIERVADTSNSNQEADGHQA